MKKEIVMNKEIVEFEKELNKLRKHGATGISMFVRRNEDASISDYARDAVKMLRYMRRSKTKI